MGFQGKRSNQKQVSTLVCVFRASHKLFFQPFYRLVQALLLLLPGHFTLYAHPRKKHMFQGLKSRSGPGQSFAGCWLGWPLSCPVNKPALLYSLAGGEGCVFGSPLLGVYWNVFVVIVLDE